MAGLAGLTMKQDIKSPNELPQRGIAEQKCHHRRSDSEGRDDKDQEMFQIFNRKKMVESDGSITQLLW